METAREYNRTIKTSMSWNGFRFWLVTRYERITVLNQIAMWRGTRDTVVDCPCGTGKLYKDLSDRFENYIGLDISPVMIQVLKENYFVSKSSFRIFDLQKERIEVKNSILICLRLMHRVPPEVRLEMLENISMISSVAIISYGIDNPWLRFKRSLCSIREAKLELEQYFDILSVEYVLKGVSEQVVFSVIPKK
jgi:SAM-dependent methyltransferase